MKKLVKTNILYANLENFCLKTVFACSLDAGWQLIQT